MKLRFYHCNVCGKTLAILTDTGVPTMCCGQEMEEIQPNRTDGAAEKHVPVVSATGRVVTIQVGSALHPMTETHSIRWIGIQTTRGFQFAELHPGDWPEACFTLCPEDKFEAAYAYCDIHGLWCAE